MNTRTAGGKALLGSALLIALALGSSFWLVAAEQRRLYNEDLTRQLLTAARMLREALRDGWASLDAGGIAGLVHTLRSEGASVVVMSADGHVLVDTVGESRIADGLLEQPEVRQALLTGWGEQTRRLPDDVHQSQAVAVRVGDDESTLGVVWLARPVWTVRAAWDSLGKLIAMISAIALLATLTLALVLTYVRTRLLRRLTETARSLSAGDFSAHSDVGGSDELAMLSSALNQMRKRFAEQVETIDRQRLTLESLVAQLHEGVIVTRPDGCIALINPAATELLNLSTDAHADHRTMIGLPLEHCVPQYDLQEMLRGGQPTSASSDAGHDRGPPADDSPPSRPAERDVRLQIDTPTSECCSPAGPCFGRGLAGDRRGREAVFAGADAGADRHNRIDAYHPYQD